MFGNFSYQTSSEKNLDASGVELPKPVVTPADELMV